MDQPTHWSPGMSTIVQRRGPMPNVHRWQSTYVRYGGQQEGQVSANGWELSSSRIVHEGVQVSGFPLGSTAMNCGAPTGVQMKIVTAPAEFAVPVKQDR